jgi:hypothetical protein
VPLVPIYPERVVPKKPRENRVPIMMSDEELKAIDDWRFENRIATRSDAVRRLCQIALAIDQKSAIIVKQTMLILKHRTEDAAEALALDSRREIISQKRILEICARGLVDHTRLVLAVQGLLGPIEAMREADELKVVFELAKKARAGMGEILGDLAALERDFAQAFDDKNKGKE